MKIEYLGHSSFKLTESTGTSVVCDPYAADVGFEMDRVRADAVTVSHGHFDHNNINAVEGNPIVLDKECSYDLPGVEIDAIKSFHDKQRGKKRGENLIFKFRMDGIDVCHLGDLGEDCSSELIDLLLPVNVLLIPVGGTYTIDAATAKKYVDAIAPDAVIPMHYRTPESKIDIAKIDGFLALCKGVEIDNVGSELCLSTHDICGFKGKIIVMERV